jgi:hypothetical protein
MFPSIARVKKTRSTLAHWTASPSLPLLSPFSRLGVFVATDRWEERFERKNNNNNNNQYQQPWETLEVYYVCVPTRADGRRRIGGSNKMQSVLFFFVATKAITQACEHHQKRNEIDLSQQFNCFHGVRFR